MHYLLFVGFFLFFAFIAPLKVTLLSCVLVIVATLVVTFAAKAIANVAPTVGESFKAVALSFFFGVIALFTLVSFSHGTGITSFTGLPAVAVFCALLASYVLGFKVALRTGFLASALIALVSTVVSGALIWSAKGLV